MGTGVWYPWIRCCRTLFPLYLYLLILSRMCCKGDVCLPHTIPMYVYFNETAASGSVIFVSNETNAIRKEWSLSSYEPRVALTFVKGTYQVVLLSAVDLDVANRWKIMKAFESMLQLIPDDICSPPEQFVKRIHCYRNGEDPKDAGEYFIINSSTGILYQVKNFDYEDTSVQCNMGKEGGFLNITAEDGLHKTSKSLSVTFINIDDAPPVFVNSVCSTVCFTCPISSLSAIVHITHHGPILTNPPDVKAIDLNTKQSNIIAYTLDVYPTKYKDIIRFENSRFVLLQSFANFSKYSEESDFTVIVTMQATGSNGQTSDKFAFTIYVMVGPISSTSQQPSWSRRNESTITNQSTKDIKIIVLAVIVALLLSVILVYAVYRIRTHKKKAEDNETSYEEVKRNTVKN